MTTAIDLALLEAQKGPEISLLGRTRVSGAATGGDYSGFSTLPRLDLAIRVDRIEGDSGSSLTVLVEHSDDAGVSWSTAASHAFTRDDLYRVVVSAPKDLMRVRWSVAGGLRRATIGSVTAVPAFIQSTADGGSLPAQWQFGDAGNVEIVPDGPLGASLAFINFFAPATFDTSLMRLQGVGSTGPQHKTTEVDEVGGLFAYNGFEIKAHEDDDYWPFQLLADAALANDYWTVRILHGVDLVFGITADGTVHIKTGTTIVADL